MLYQNQLSGYLPLMLQPWLHDYQEPEMIRLRQETEPLLQYR